MVAEKNTESNREKHDVLKSTQTVIHKALEKLGYPEEVYELLKEPLRMLTVKIPVRMDDGSSENIYRLPCSSIMMQLVRLKGGIRFHPDVTETK